MSVSGYVALVEPGSIYVEPTSSKRKAASISLMFILHVEQQGNNIADKIANEFRVKGDLLPPVPYFTATEERCGLSHGSSLVQGDPRGFLKHLEKEQMYQCWKKQAPKQFEWFSC